MREDAAPSRQQISLCHFQVFDRRILYHGPLNVAVEYLAVVKVKVLNSRTHSRIFTPDQPAVPKGTASEAKVKERGTVNGLQLLKTLTSILSHNSSLKIGTLIPEPNRIDPVPLSFADDQ
ncbi:MAG: hypothetical protein ACHRHE_17415 [Tepidisphaerales bacterium]